MVQLEFKSKQSYFRVHALKLYAVLFIIVHNTVQVQVHIRIEIPPSSTILENYFKLRTQLFIAFAIDYRGLLVMYFSMYKIKCY